jgi:uncharacterized protein (DUF1697 family)
MTTYVALLRGINVGGHKKVAMADLCEVVRGLDLEEVRSLLQSGNLVFRSAGRTAAQLEGLLEEAIERRLGLQSKFFVRSNREWGAVIAGNPFRAEAERDPGRLVVMFLKEAPDGGRVEALRAAIVGPEVLHAEGRQVYVVYPNGAGTSRFTHTVIEKTLGTRATGRNWNTVQKLGVLAGG